MQAYAQSSPLQGVPNNVFFPVQSQMPNGQVIYMIPAPMASMVSMVHANMNVQMPMFFQPLVGGSQNVDKPQVSAADVLETVSISNRSKELKEFTSTQKSFIEYVQMCARQGSLTAIGTAQASTLGAFGQFNNNLTSESKLTPNSDTVANSGETTGAAFKLQNPSMNLKRPLSADTTSLPGTATKLRKRTQKKRRCRHEGCMKLSRGSSMLCISHGGGKRCSFPNCNTGAEGVGKVIYCKRHGGGRRCLQADCSKSARGGTMYCIAHGGGKRCKWKHCTKAAVGPTDFCISHGGGRRCTFAGGCHKAAQGSTKFCKAHGGGRRCKKEGCTRSAEGATFFCVSHGGGRRCKVPGCTKSAQGRTHCCKGHGGGRRCQVPGCTKSAQGATDFCKAHGGGRRCQYGGCEKSARGTSFCIGHGGGKRCAHAGCKKSAVGSTKTCIAHGGGKRCKFDDCTTSARGGSEYCRAHNTMISKGTVSKECQ